MKILLTKSSDKVALAGLDFSFAYNEVLRRANAISKCFGANPERIAIFAENSPSWVFALYGAWLSGATVVPIDAKSSADELAFILEDAEPEAICADSANLQLTKDVCARLQKAPRIVDIDSPDIAKNCDASPSEIRRELEDLALIVYTSGTTGNPKGVMLTFANLSANMEAVAQAKYYTPGIRVLAMLPFHHILPLMGTLIMPLSIEGKLVFPRSLSPAEISGALQKHPVDMIISVPRFYELMHANIMAKISESKLASALFSAAKLINCRKFSEVLFSSIHKKFGGQVKFWISGGAALDKKVWRDMDILGFGIREGYGMTECAPIITFPRIGNIRIGSPGQALPGIEIRIVDGEIAVRGGNVTRGYYKRPEETAESIRNGWLFTGDLGYLDDDGFLFITGRRKEIIVLANGKNLNPAEMEAAISKYSADILECGVLMYNNTLHAIVRVPPEFRAMHGEEGALEKIRNEAILPYNRATAPYKRIIRLSLTTDEFPRTRVGKLKRYHLSAYLDGSAKSPASDAPEPAGEVYGKLRAMLASQLSVPPRPDAHMEMDLGLDSLGKISVQSFVKENFNVDIGERDFERHNTLRKLSEYIDETRDKSFEHELKNITWHDIINAKPYPEIIAPNFFHFATIIFMRTLCGICYKLSTKGFESASNDSPQIIAPNHQSYLDGLFITQKFSKTQLYKTYFFAKLRKILKSGLLRKFADRSNVIVMDINDNVSESIRKLAQALRRGNKVVVFPEGTRTKDGLISEFKQSFAILAKEMRVPVVPVAIRGAYEALKPGATLPSLGAKVNVTYLPEMRIGEDESCEDFSERVRAAIESAWENMR